MGSSRKTELLRCLEKVEYQPNANRFPVEIGGVRLDIITSSPVLMTQIANLFSSYYGQGNTVAELYLEAHDHSYLWEDPNSEFDIQDPYVVQRDFAAKRLSSENKIQKAVAILPTGLDDSIHNLLRWFLPPLLLNRGAFLMHAAGLIRNGLGYVFFGQSGAGKSTTVGLAKEYDSNVAILGDDAVIIQMSHAAAQPRVFTAPLGSSFFKMSPLSIDVPLAGLYSLQQETKTEIKNIGFAEGVASLLASAMSVRFQDSIEERMALAARFAFSNPGIKRLFFKRDPEFWNIIINGALEIQPSSNVFRKEELTDV